MAKVSTYPSASALTGTEVAYVVQGANSRKTTTAAIGALGAGAVTDVANDAAMVALTADVGDVARKADNRIVYMLQALPASTLGNWKQIGSTVDPATVPYVHIGAATDARPITGGLVIWVVPTTPVNATSSDLWVQPVGA